MTDSERQQVLKMVEQGKISANEGLKLLQALADDGPVEVVETIETEPTEGEVRSDADFDQKIGRFRRLWTIPFWSGILLTILSACWMFSALHSAFWFAVAFLPFLLGVALTVIGLESRASRWIYIKVQQNAGQEPGLIAFSFPLSVVGWLVGLLGGYIPSFQKGVVDDVLQAVFRSTESSEPLFVDVHEAGGRQHVQVYIG
jgi:hypothetical protein